MRYACAPATAASSPFPIPAPEAGRTAWRTFAGPCAPTRTWPSTRFRSAERSKRLRRRRGSPTRICPTPANSSRPSIRTALAGAKGESWAEALAGAEARYGHEKHDILVTPEKSAEMARPIIDPKAKPAADPKASPAVAQRAGSPEPLPPQARRNAAVGCGECAGAGCQRRRHQAQRGGRHSQPRGLGHRRRRRAERKELHREPGADGAKRPDLTGSNGRCG